ncbi:MAG: viroplasmin family protein [Nanoarchaeales archaeon]|nr:viroplasmin family protein [Nanoarchaeales archaeon]
MAAKKKFYYAYVLDDDSGIFNNWDECSKKVSGTAARYKKFKTLIEANLWIDSGAIYDKSKVKKKNILGINFELEEGIYFDAGTGRGDGVEVKVTDESEKSLLHQVLKSEKITKFDTYFLGKAFTNNFGELSGLFFALNIAMKNDVKLIFGDSKLVLDYWSNGIYKKDLPIHTIDLIKKIMPLRKEFESNGGKLEFISGDLNPADLGFHK